MESLDGSMCASKICTKEKCIGETTRIKSHAINVNELFIFVCTKLPLYRLKLFFTKNYRGYICIGCVNVPEELKITFNKQEESLKSSSAGEKFKDARTS